MKNQASFSSKDKRKKLKCRLLQFLFGALRANLKRSKNIIGFLVTTAETSRSNLGSGLSIICIWVIVVRVVNKVCPLYLGVIDLL